MHYDVFNGDADGICALVQLRLAEPKSKSILITGVKRDITLLAKLSDISESSITVLDISLDRNRPYLENLLAAGNSVLYIDHHFAGEIPENKNLQTWIDPAADRCTSLIVNSHLQGKYRKWAIAGAFGDNLHKSALQAASETSLTEIETSKLRELGELLNYNGYGASIDDLHFAPDDLYRAALPYEDPLDFFSSSPTMKTLAEGFSQDMKMALERREEDGGGSNRIYHFPNFPWARRVAGVFSNLRAREKPEVAHCLLVDNTDSSIRISVRAPLDQPKNADTLCRLFPGGGGRAAAAGINNLPPELLVDFLDSFRRTYR